MVTITNKGLEAYARMISGVSAPSAFTYMSTGTGSGEESTSDTALEAANTSNGLQRQAATCTFASPGTSQWNKLFTATGAGTIREVGIHNASSGGDMLLRHLLSENKSYASGDSVEITITVTIGRS